MKNCMKKEETKYVAADNELSKPYNKKAAIYKAEIDSALSVELFHEL